ncbi:MAG: hypothetical protein ACUVQF_05525 [Fervidobacterium sp.]|uniref:hypothetical protein n=1 Tax=Fervidobacterium sp. TaxID=1871331 RepID=UPI00404947CC
MLIPYAAMLNTKIWICEKIGRRLSCIARAGDEKYSESFIVYEDEKYLMFAEREVDEDEYVLIREIVERVKEMREPRESGNSKE